MKINSLSLFILVSLTLLGGCVSRGTYTQTVAELKQARDQAVTLQGSLDDANARLKEARETLVAAQAEATTLKGQVASLQVKVTEITGQLREMSAQLATERDKMNAERQNISARHENLNSQLDDLQKQLSEIRSLQGRTMAELSGKNAQIKSLEETISQLHKAGADPRP